jgi:hypothetical protein
MDMPECQSNFFFFYIFTRFNFFRGVIVQERDEKNGIMRRSSCDG